MSAETAPEKTEPWVFAAYVIFGCTLALVVYLALRLPGVGPVRAYVMGPIVLAALAFFTGLFGLVVSLRRRPFVRRERLRGAACLGLVIAGVTYPIPVSGAPRRTPQSGRVSSARARGVDGRVGRRGQPRQHAREDPR